MALDDIIVHGENVIFSLPFAREDLASNLCAQGPEALTVTLALISSFLPLSLSSARTPVMVSPDLRNS